MKAIVLFASLFLASVTFAQKQVLDNLGNDDPNLPEFKFEKDEYNFGEITQGESVTYEFKFTNAGNGPLIISAAEGSCGCTVPIYPKEPIMKGQTSATIGHESYSASIALYQRTLLPHKAFVTQYTHTMCRRQSEGRSSQEKVEGRLSS